ncbi:hypothetical protein POL68_32535 [Stigmatella sp. ncwal1]|uniref:Lipoprotein n=1 Tax=Stigmatella ashevillensis TaxID=2995309 RepID=A0ABT5DHU5_9BACT|nr:hypothetical protein [Stigmatella ashevillena]MDC0713235.1 hypothetical protein [Stigmatella ashevillena]
MSPPFRVLLTSLALLGTGCGPLFFIEAETEEVCKTERGLSFVGAAPTTVSLQQTVLFPLEDLADALPDGDTEATLRLRRFELTATQGNPDLRGIERAIVSLRKPGQTALTPLLEYRRPSSGTAPQAIAATGIESVDLVDQLREEELELVFEARGSLPPQDWKADFRACAGLKVKVDYLDVVF